MARLCDEESCVVAHAFVGNAYSDANEIIWLVAEIESKLELNREQTEMWCDKLTSLAGNSAFTHFRLWLISSEGFSSEASALLKERNAYGSNRHQAELLAALAGGTPGQDDRALVRDDFVMILPMGGDNELLAAQVVEQVARRMNFRTEAINQIKTAVVEAWINAAEHSHSPDQKIYQRFLAENDRLVITISSRGVVPVNLQIQNIEQGPQLSKDSDTAEERRGWGLKLIQTLMDEVEFERVDEGTSLRMVKYLRS
jgi:serine/threonine-protein kinase RsbW